MLESILILNVVINCVCVFSTVLEVPQNLAVVVGQRTSLSCKTSNGTVREWLFEKGSSAGLKVFTNWGSFNPPSADSGYGVDIDSYGSGELFINDTQLENAGKYSCVTDVNRTITRYYAELIVLETEPVCTVTKHNDVAFEAECSVNFSGSWAPKMEWQYNGVYLNKTSNNASKSRVTSNVEAVIRKDAFTISCTIRFSHSNGSSGPSRVYQTTATNDPGYVYIWNSNTASKESDETGINAATSYPSFPSDAKDSTSGGPLENMTMMYIVPALASALILLK